MFEVWFSRPLDSSRINGTMLLLISATKTQRIKVTQSFVIEILYFVKLRAFGSLWQIGFVS